ncbi:MAG TPA: PmoA family protein [Chloroflexota bacterium]|nr:PmoA family protein [Chloroflexota bacterium]
MIEPMDMLVKAGYHPRRACPVWVQLPLQESGIPTVRLTDADGNPVPCQVEPSGGGQDDRLWLTWIVRDLDVGEERRYHLEPVTTAEGEGESGAASGATDHGPGVVLTELPDGKLAVQVNGEDFTTYNFGSDVVRPYFYPLLGPNGKSIVRTWPMVKGPDGKVEGETSDHPHHKGLYVAHGDVNGTDHWSEGPNHSTMRHAGFQRLVSGPVYGSFDETVEWLDRDGTRVVLQETRRVTIFNLEPDERIIDLSLRFQASSGTVTFGDTKEGGLVSIRVASSMDGPTRSRPDGVGRIENSYGGRQEEETWGKRAMWCDYYGPVDGDIVGVCLMDHPTNPRYPTHWHVRAYGLMTANPFGLHDFYNDPDTHRGDWTIPANESRNFLYRVLLHRGSTSEARVAERYHDFVNIPSVQLQP